MPLPEGHSPPFSNPTGPTGTSRFPNSAQAFAPLSRGGRWKIGQAPSPVRCRDTLPSIALGCIPRGGRAYTPRRKLLDLISRPTLELAVDPDSSGPDPAEPLAPGRDRLARVRYADLAVVPVDLFEPIGGLVTRARGSVGQSD